MSLFKRKPWTGKTELLFSDKALTALILPLFLEQLLSVFVGLSDSIMVAQVGEAAVSAVSLVDSMPSCLSIFLMHWQQEELLFRDNILVPKIRKRLPMPEDR